MEGTPGSIHNSTLMIDSLYTFMCVCTRFAPLRACTSHRALLFVAEGVARERRKPSVCVVTCECSSRHKRGEPRMLAQAPRERRTGEGGVKLWRDATAPQAHRRSYGGSLHRTINVKSTGHSRGSPIAVEAEVEGRGGGTFSETTVRITESRRHSSFLSE